MRQDGEAPHLCIPRWTPRTYSGAGMGAGPPGHQRERACGQAGEGTLKESRYWTSLARARQTAREEAVRPWKEEWHRQSLTGRYAYADQREPSTHPPKHFETLPRRLYALVTQCRTGHAFIGEYYNQFIPTKATECSCGCALQTRTHILRHCPRYKQHQYLLQRAVPNLDLANILGTPHSISALTAFIKRSGAFKKQ